MTVRGRQEDGECRVTEEGRVAVKENEEYLPQIMGITLGKYSGGCRGLDIFEGGFERQCYRRIRRSREQDLAEYEWQMWQDCGLVAGVKYDIEQARVECLAEASAQAH